MAAPNDTICALASGLLPSALAMVRVSGPKVSRLIAAHLDRAPLQPRRATLTHIRSRDGRLLDEAIAVYIPGPGTYTGEDTLELTLHGGRAIVAGVLSAFLEHDDVRLAEPGEFTRRAVDAGKMDLLGAEAVADLVEAETVAQRDQALAQLGGTASEIVAQWHEALLEAQVRLEVAIDFPDEADAPEYDTAPIAAVLRTLQDAIGAQLSGDVGEQVREGFRVVLVGAPNAGKSSLLNRLAGRDAAIVTEIPGTTRDVVEVKLDLGGLPAWVSDTAGLRETTDPVEREGIARTYRAIDRADLVIHLVAPGDEAGDLPEDVAARRIEIASQSDLGRSESVSRETLSLSAETGEGVEALISLITQRLTEAYRAAPPSLITRARHRQRLGAASAAIDRAVSGLGAGLDAELVAEDVRAAARELELLIGRVDVEDILGGIFSRFCIGK